MSEPNLYRRGGVWWLRATVAGKEYRESLRTRDLKSARRLRQKRLDEIAAARYRGERSYPWLQVVTDWLEHSARQLARSTLRRYVVSLKMARPHFERYSIDKIDSSALMAFSRAREKEGASPATIRRDHTAISRVLDFAEAMEWREGNPTLSTRRHFKEYRDPIVLPLPEEVETVIAAASPRFGALIRAAWLTGCRQAELVTVRWRTFDAHMKTLQVIGKGNKTRIHPA